MTIARFVLHAGDASRPAAGGGRCPATQVRPVTTWGDAERTAVTLLARACAAVAPGVAGAFEPGGLKGELQSRPGRRVHCWFAEDVAAAVDCPACPRGLVSLVVSGAGTARRFSIAWLLVHPQARRLGLGTHLVAIAVSHARLAGADTVHAETLGSWPAAVAFWQAVGFERLS